MTRGKILKKIPAFSTHQWPLFAFLLFPLPPRVLCQLYVIVTRGKLKKKKLCLFPLRSDPSLHSFFSDSLHVSCLFFIHPFSHLGLPSELPLSLQKKQKAPPELPFSPNLLTDVWFFRLLPVCLALTFFSSSPVG